MKEILYNFSKARARNAQHVQFATDVLAAVPEETATAQGFAPQRTVFASAMTVGASDKPISAKAAA